MAAPFGLSASGFNPMRQSDIISQMEAQFQTVFGQNINFGPESIFGQIVGINSGREALVWAMGQAVYNSQNPNGAQGISVDNILALSNLRRLLATPTRTNTVPLVQSNGITLYGLVLYGTAGTVIQQGSVIKNTASPPLQFTTDQPITIGPALNAVQNLYFSNTPTVGAFSLTFEDQLGNNINTSSLPFNVLGNVSQLNFSSVPSSGTFDLILTKCGTPQTLAALTSAMNAGTLQSAIVGLGYTGVTVTGSYGSGFQITWPSIAPILTTANNTMGVTITKIDSVQSILNNLIDTGTYPFTDVSVVSAVNGLAFTFGAFSPFAGQVSNSALPQPIIVVNSNTLLMNTTVTNIKILTTTNGQPAQGTGSATCTVDGVNFVPAGALTVIGSSVSGWTGVTNQLDCVTGTALETDTDALIRRSLFLQAQANGPLASIREKVSALPGVTACVGFQNLNGAALQVLTFSSVPVTGSYKIILQSGLTGSIPYNANSAAVQAAIVAIPGYTDALVTGSTLVGFTIDFNGAFGGQAQALSGITANSTGVTITPSFGRPGHSFEIVVQGGSDQTIAQTILGASPAGIQSYGSTTVVVFDNVNNAYNISFSRPIEVPIYVVINLTTDLTTSQSPQFNIGSVSTISQDVVTTGNEVSIGGLIIGFGSNGLVGCFNNLPGILDYTIAFGRTPSPSGNANIQLQPEEVPVFESFNVQISYT